VTWPPRGDESRGQRNGRPQDSRHRRGRGRKFVNDLCAAEPSRGGRTRGSRGRYRNTIGETSVRLNIAITITRYYISNTRVSPMFLFLLLPGVTMKRR